jgi:hypothetical protein
MNHDTWPAPKPTDRHYVPPVQLPITTAEQIRRAVELADRVNTGAHMFHAEAALWAMYLVGDIHEAPEAGHGRSLSAVA